MNEATLSSILRFRPWPGGDPVAPWLIDQLDKNQLVQLARVGLELNQAVLQAQLKANTQSLEIIGAAKK
jgi:hypothetical protein